MKKLTPREDTQDLSPDSLWLPAKSNVLYAAPGFAALPPGQGQAFCPDGVHLLSVPH